jgi:hypothetical protein
MDHVPECQRNQKIHLDSNLVSFRQSYGSSIWPKGPDSVKLDAPQYFELFCLFCVQHRQCCCGLRIQQRSNCSSEKTLSTYSFFYNSLNLTLKGWGLETFEYSQMHAGYIYCLYKQNQWLEEFVNSPIFCQILLKVFLRRTDLCRLS